MTVYSIYSIKEDVTFISTHDEIAEKIEDQ